MAAPTGNIYAQTLLQHTKKAKDLRNANKEVFSGVGRSVYCEVELTNYGPILVDNYQREKNLRLANKEVYTPDLSRAVMERKDDHQAYGKHLIESHNAESQRQLGNKGAHNTIILCDRGYNTQTYAKALNEKNRAENQKQLANKGAHTGDIYRTVFEKAGTTTQTYAKSLNEKNSVERQRQLANKGAHNGDISRSIFGGSTGAIPERVKSQTTLTTVKSQGFVTTQSVSRPPTTVTPPIFM